MPIQNLVELIRDGKVDDAKGFLKENGLSEDVGEFGESSLMAAIQTQNFDIAKEILNLHPDISHEDEEGWSAIECAARAGNLDIFSKIIELGGDVNRKLEGIANRGMTPLHWAANSGHYNIVKLCIENGAIVDAVNQHGRTPLMYVQNSKKIARYLIDVGASLTLQNNSGRNASEEHFFQSQYWDPENRRSEISKITKPSL